MTNQIKFNLLDDDTNMIKPGDLMSPVMKPNGSDFSDGITKSITFCGNKVVSHNVRNTDGSWKFNKVKNPRKNTRSN